MQVRLAIRACPLLYSLTASSRTGTTCEPTRQHRRRHQLHLLSTQRQQRAPRRCLVCPASIHPQRASRPTVCTTLSGELVFEQVHLRVAALIPSLNYSYTKDRLSSISSTAL